MSRATMRSETKTAMAQIGISLHGVKSKAFYQFVCKPCLDMLFPVAEDQGLRDLADSTMLQFLSPYFNVLSKALPAQPPPPPLKTKFAPPPPPLKTKFAPLRDVADFPPATSATSTAPYNPPGAPPVKKYHCYWEHGRNQQPVGTITTEWDRPAWRWTGYGPDDWEWSPYWSWTNGHWQFDG